MVGYFSDEELRSLRFRKLGENVRISKTSMLYNCGNIEIGSNVRIDNFCTIALSGAATLVIGDYVHISAYNFINGAADIVIGNYVTTAPYVRIFSSGDDYSGEHMTGGVVPRALIGTITAPVRVGRHVIIGTGSSILQGVTLADGTAVGAHSLVRKSTEAFSIVAGSPAKEIGKRSDHLLTLVNRIHE